MKTTIQHCLTAVMVVKLKTGLKNYTLHELITFKGDLESDLKRIP